MSRSLFVLIVCYTTIADLILTEKFLEEKNNVKEEFNYTVLMAVAGAVFSFVKVAV